VSGVVLVALVDEKNLLAALGDDAKGRIGYTMQALQCGRAAEIQTFQWLNQAIFTNDPGDTLDQLLSVGLHPVGLALYLLGIQRIHRNFLTHSYPSFIKVCRIVQ
jgi:hypothetical protein